MIRNRLPTFILSLCLSLGAYAAVDLRSSRAGAAGQLAQAITEVSATVETEPVPHSGDAADDPAIWIHPSQPSLSTIIGTDKLGGLAVYDLAGHQIQFLADGNICTLLTLRRLGLARDGGGRRYTAPSPCIEAFANDSTS